MGEERKNLTLDEMREKRGIAEVVFKKFTEAQSRYSTYAFCFFEGEDGKYYNSRIEKYWGNKYIPLVAGKKKEVIKVMGMIKANSFYDSVCTMFFVDHDYDEHVSGEHKDLFETPCYSIENFYAQEDTFCKIITAEFGLAIIDPDYHKCLNTYKKRFEEFNEIISVFNALMKYQHQFKPEVKCPFSAVSTTDLVHLSVDKIEKTSGFDSKMRELEEKLSVDEKTLLEIREDLLANQPELAFRGKNQLDFMASMITMLRELNNKGEYFSTKLKRVYLNISKNRLSELSQYAVTPQELTTFLEAHRPHGIA